MKVEELRKSFLSYFKNKGHTVVPSGALVPLNDETLLFTNAGMVPFKDVFLGQVHMPYTKATSSQLCVRAGGKHNDLENVGYTARHHTFFEMLGNFSFGDYFKKEAIQLAWEYLTQELKLPPEKLWVTVYEEDDEAASIWLNEIKVDKARFSRCGAKDNFWSMGETGPCGPCTEIFYDHGDEVEGGPPGSPDEEGDRYVEIWNLVFMQHNRDTKGNLSDLPKPSVDTGMGLERLAAVMQGVHSNYDIDLFKNIIEAAKRILESHHRYSKALSDADQKSLRVLADHIRSTVFLINEGVHPSNEGRGYVLRRIIRRALRHGNKLGADEPFFYCLVEALVKEMGTAYPQIKEKQSEIEKIILKEEYQFERTLEQGLKILEEDIRTMHGHVIDGEILFKLYDTYGFPVDLTADIARERNLQVDIAGFEREMEAQRQRARGASQFSGDFSNSLAVKEKSEFRGYDSLEERSLILAIFKGDEKVSMLKEGDKGQMVLEHTPFYAESGGQVGDKGWIETSEGIFVVEDTQKVSEAIVHRGMVKKGCFSEQEDVLAKVDGTLRAATRLNHSATHLLHAALREILGTHVIQKGSLVEPARLRFDFSHFESLSAEQLEQIEARVNEKILENTDAVIKEMTPAQAIKAGAIALFGEKYGKKVRVLDMGNGYSVELCGGTHVSRTGDIGLFKITTETSIASGVRRIEGITGMGAIQRLSASDRAAQELAGLLKTQREAVLPKVKQLLEKLRDSEKEIQRLKAKLASGAGTDLSDEAVQMGDLKVLVKKLDDIDPKLMRDLVDSLKNKLGSGVILLGAVSGEKVQLIAGVTKDCTNKLSAKDLVNIAAEQVGGKGGGRPDLAQAGGSQPQHIDKALSSAADWIKERL